MGRKWTTATLNELAWPNDGTWPEFISVGTGDGRGPDAEYRTYKPSRSYVPEGWSLTKELLKERDFYFNQVLENEERHDKAYGILAKELGDMRKLCEWLLEPYRLGAVTGEGIDREWCRDTYGEGIKKLRGIGSEADE